MLNKFFCYKLFLPAGLLFILVNCISCPQWLAYLALCSVSLAYLLCSSDKHLCLAQCQGIKEIAKSGTTWLVWGFYQTPLGTGCHLSSRILRFGEAQRRQPEANQCEPRIALIPNVEVIETAGCCYFIRRDS